MSPVYYLFNSVIDRPTHPTPTVIDMASFRGSSALPDEIIDHIASHLWDDFPTLSAASLVCQTWHGMVRPYVFRSVTILLGNEARMQVLMDMVERTTPMAHWIRELRIAHPKTRIPSFQLWQLWTSDAYGPFMKKLERLHSLVFVDMAVYLMKPPTLEEMLALPTRISEFHGHTIRAVSYVDCRLPKPLALPFVRCLPLLQSMTLVNTKFWPTSVKFDETMYGSVLKSACAVVPHLTTLSVRAQEFAPSIHELFPLESLRTLRTLLFDANQFPDELTVMLQSIGPSLYSFRLNCPYSRYFPDADRKFHYSTSNWSMMTFVPLSRHCQDSYMGSRTTPNVEAPSSSC